MPKGLYDEDSLNPEVVANGESWPTPVQPMQQVKTTYTTAVAVQKARNLREVDTRLKEEAALLGDRAYYGWGAGKDHIEGPSHDLAIAAARCYGNCAIDHQEIKETPNAFIFTAYFVDLETGMTISRPFRQSKRWTIYGKMDEFRKEDIRFQIGASKAARNVILEALPKVLIDHAMDEAKKGVRDKVDKYIKENGIESARQRMVKALQKAGISEERILAKVEKSTVAGLTVDDLVLLQGDLRALQDGAESAMVLFPPIGQEAQASPSKSQTEALKDELRQSGKAPSPSPAEQATEQKSGGMITKDQAKTLKDLAKQHGYTHHELERYAKGIYGVVLDQLPAAKLTEMSEHIATDDIGAWLMDTENAEEVKG